MRMICTDFTESALCALVAQIHAQTAYFVEVVNLNVRNGQYVCAGDLRALDLLQRLCDAAQAHAAATPLSPETLPDLLDTLVPRLAQAYLALPTSPTEIRLRHGAATVPLAGVDVPFHSSYLRPRMDAFRRVLLDHLDVARLSPEKLVGRYVPNVTGKPLALTREYFEESLRITGSERIRKVLEEWDTTGAGSAQVKVEVA